MKETWILIKTAFTSWSDDYAQSMGAALAYYTLFSIAPLLLIVISITGFVFGEEAARGEIAGQLQNLMGEQGALAVQSLVENAVKHNRSRRECLHVRIETRILAGSVSLTVEDDGLGFPSQFEPPPQHGLERLREALHLLFGPAARLEMSVREPTGARVTIALPGALI